jgi:phage terminase large subunit
MIIQTTKVFSEIDNAVKEGKTTVSLQGSSRSSKTYNILIWIIIFCLNYSNIRVSIVRATLPALKGSVFIDFKEIMMNMLLFDEKALNKTELTYHLSNGSWFEFFSTDSEQKLRGRKRDILFVNEGNELTFTEWMQLKMRTTQLAIIDYNPSFTDEHWLCQLNQESRTKHIITTYRDNPFLEQTVIDEIESLRYKNESLWKIYGLGIQAQIEGLIFTNVEIIEYLPNAKHISVGMDFGFTNDPTAIVEVIITSDTIYLNEICYRTEMVARDIIQILNSRLPDRRIISESADPRLIKEIHNAGINIIPVEKFPGSIEAGINKMLEYRICITKSSYNIIKELKNYTYQQDKEGKWLNKPIDQFNHAIDAVRYVVLTEALGKNRKKKNLNGYF